MIDDRLTVAELRAMQLRALNDRAESGIQPSHDELVAVYARLCWQMEQRVRTATREQRDPHRAMMAGFKALIGEMGSQLASIAKRQATLAARIVELEADASRTPKAKVKVKARGVPA